jgi:hypothetical protein
VSYTLRGRLESRLAVLALPFFVACVLALALQEWWLVQLFGLMAAVGLALDLAVYHRLLAYQVGWLALPLGLLELALTVGLALALDVAAPLEPALAFFAGSWVVAQLLTHAGLPLARLSYAEDGGELGRGGRVLGVAAPVAAAAVLGVAWATQPPTIHLAAGVHDGPLVLDRAQTLIGEPGAVVRGGIRITADDVEVRDVAVVGGEYGFEIRDADRVVLDGVSVIGASLDGIHARRSAVTIRDCHVRALAGPRTQGIDISFGMGSGHTLVEGCTIVGASEGIATHFAHVDLRENRITDTGLRGIAMTEMSMGEIEGNEVVDALGVGIFCGDYSECEIDRNLVRGTRADTASALRTRQGYAIQAHYGASASVGSNTLVGNARGPAAFLNSEIVRR